MPSDISYVYWDACVFLDFFNAHPERIKTLDDILIEIARDKHRKIVTSVLSQTEIAFVQTERQGAVPDQEIERRLDNFWQNKAIIELVDIHSMIALQARSYIRQVLPKGWKLTPADAIHLATAKWVGVQEFHTYDSKLDKHASIIGLTMCHPYVIEPRLL